MEMVRTTLAGIAGGALAWALYKLEGVEVVAHVFFVLAFALAFEGRKK